MNDCPPEPPDTLQWYYLNENEPYGPVAGSELRRLVATGALAGSTLVWREGLDVWLAAEEAGFVMAGHVPMAPPVVQTQVSSPSRSGAGQTTRLPKTRSAKSGTPRRNASTQRLAWIITAAVALVLGGFVAGYALHSRSTRSSARLETGPAGRERSVTNRNASGARENASCVKTQPNRDAGVPEHGSSSDAGPGFESGVLRNGDDVGTTSVPGAGSPIDVGTTDSRSPSGLGAESGAPVSSTARSGLPAQLFQLVTVHKRLNWDVLTTSMTQDIQYVLLSKLNMQPHSADGSVRVTQQVLDTRLDRVDEMSRSSFVSSLADLKGARFDYTLNGKGEVTRFDSGRKSGLKAVPVESADKSGFRLTQVMDDDGWKELIQLSFLEPARHIAPGQNWTRQMAHDFGELGRWDGVTTFSQDTSQPPPLLHFQYNHAMAFTPAKSFDSGLPIRITDVKFRLVNAGGTFVYDPAEQHVTQVSELFHIKGTLGADLAGTGAGLSMDERQQVSIKLTTQNPWARAGGRE